MRFLNTRETKMKIKKLMETSPTADLAVAFWGNGALEELGINTCNTQLRIICNLSLGGTNPDVITRLQTVPSARTVTQNDRLHAKVYLFENAAVIGSSNASANGLALEGAELTHWDEANILVTDKATLENIRSWMDRLETRPITEQDLARAQDRWKKRRSYAPIPGDTVLQVLHKDPEKFKDRNAYLVIYFEALSEEAVAFEENLQKQYHTDRVEIFEAWPGLPQEGVLLRFGATPRSFRFDKIWRRKPEFSDDALDDGTTIQIVWEEEDVFGLTLERQEMAEWKRICRQIVGENGRDDAILMSLYDLGVQLREKSSQ